jgi:hypothetical protein
MPGALKTKGKKENKIITDPIPSHFLRSRSQEMHRTSRSYRNDVSSAASKKIDQEKKKSTQSPTPLHTDHTAPGCWCCNMEKKKKKYTKDIEAANA